MATNRRRHTEPSPPAAPSPRTQKKHDSRADDYETIQRALRGDNRAYERLMAKYHDAILNFIYRMVRDRQEVEDLTQEVFIKAFCSLRNFNNEFAFSTWLYKIATNNSIDFIRKRKLQMYSIDKPIEARDSEYSFELPDETYEADRSVMAQQRSTLLREAINKLPEKYRKVILLDHVDERSYEEIARDLELPIGTVKRRYARGARLPDHEFRPRLSRRHRKSRGDPTQRGFPAHRNPLRQRRR